MHDSLIRTALEKHRTPSGHSIDPEGIHMNTKGPLPTTLYILGRRSAVVKRVEHISIIVLVNI